MTEVVSIRFKSRGKLYYFDPNGLQVAGNTTVVVETSKGLELGECAHGNHWVEDERIIQPLRAVVRIATDDDFRVAELNKAREKEAFEICQRKVAEHGLDMKLVDVECSFEGNKILFFFAAEGRVDFRELVKDLAAVFRTRIELRQIGVRDEAKMLGGLGICGRQFCCSQFLDDFQPVSTKMAKAQSMSLNPTKISGVCGRLMCCLRYEQDTYEDLVRSVPKNGAFVETIDGYGNVIQINLLRQTVKVRLDGEGDQTIKTFPANEVATVPSGRPKPGEPLPSVLVIKPKTEPEPEPDEDFENLWATPASQLYNPQQPGQEDCAAPAQPRKKSNYRRPKNKPKASPRSQQGAELEKSQLPAQKSGETKKQSGKDAQRNQQRHQKGGQQQKAGKVRTKSDMVKPAPERTQQQTEKSNVEKSSGKTASRQRKYYKPKPKGGGAAKGE